MIKSAIRSTFLMAAAVAAMTFASQDAQAQCRGGGGGFYGGGSALSINVGGGYGGLGGYGLGGFGSPYVGGFNRGVSFGYSSYRPAYRPQVWQNTSQFYQPRIQYGGYGGQRSFYRPGCYR